MITLRKLFVYRSVLKKKKIKNSHLHSFWTTACTYNVKLGVLFNAEVREELYRLSVVKLCLHSARRLRGQRERKHKSNEKLMWITSFKYL